MQDGSVSNRQILEKQDVQATVKKRFRFIGFFIDSYAVYFLAGLPNTDFLPVGRQVKMGTGNPVIF